MAHASTHWVKDANTPIGFGEYADLTLREISRIHPSYFDWMYRHEVCRPLDKEDHKWMKEEYNSRTISSVDQIFYTKRFKKASLAKIKEQWPGALRSMLLKTNQFRYSPSVLKWLKQEVDNYESGLPDKYVYNNRDSRLGYGKYANLTLEQISEANPKFFRGMYDSKQVVVINDVAWFAEAAERSKV